MIVGLGLIFAGVASLANGIAILVLLSRIVRLEKRK